MSKSTITVVAYGKKISFELDTDQPTLDQIMDSVKGLTLGLGIPEPKINEWISSKAAEIASDETDEEHHHHRNCHHVWGDSDHDGHEECLICGLLREDLPQ
jgi:hypothetical protein